jgi:hypothetical protein
MFVNQKSRERNLLNYRLDKLEDRFGLSSRHPVIYVLKVGCVRKPELDPMDSGITDHRNIEDQLLGQERVSRPPFLHADRRAFDSQTSTT